MKFIDTHAHIDHEKYSGDRLLLIDRAQQAGVTRIYIPNLNLKTLPNILNIHAAHPQSCYPMIGLHPCDVDSNYLSQLNSMEEYLIQGSMFVAIGEVGLDFYWSTIYQSEQQKAFEIQIEWAKKYKLPLIIHARNSIDEVIAKLARYPKGDLSGIFHCFTGSVVQAQRIIDLGFLIGLGGLLTFKQNPQEKIAHAIALEHLVLETDSPYLAPTPYRGKLNEPAYIPYIAQKVAEIKKISIEHVAQMTTKQAEHLFHPLKT